MCFTVEARAEPGAMPRVLEQFAKRGLVPSQWHSTIVGAALQIDIQLDGMARDMAAHVARCLRQIPDVAVVLTSEKHFVHAR